MENIWRYKNNKMKNSGKLCRQMFPLSSRRMRKELIWKYYNLPYSAIVSGWMKENTSVAVPKHEKKESRDRLSKWGFKGYKTLSFLLFHYKNAKYDSTI